ncbi:MAG: nucleotidyltransferase family protein [Desulfobacterales bacterium]|nr:nucleotidyltransferase family protein [Desulfobacterales bacterium]
MMNFSNITVVILAGGLGTRLRSIVPDTPKVLAKIRGKYFLTFILDYLVKEGFEYAVLCVGYLGDQIHTAFGNLYKSLRLVYSKESYPLGTAGAIRLAMPFFKSDNVLVMNGDSICYTNLRNFITRHEELKADASMLLVKVKDVQRFGQVKVDNKGRILQFEEKNNHAGSGWINAGIYMINKKLIKEIPENVSISLEKNFFPSWICKNFYGFQSEGRFIDIGTPESYSAADYFFAGEK